MPVSSVLSEKESSMNVASKVEAATLHSAMALAFGGEWREVQGMPSYYVCRDGRAGSYHRKPRVLVGSSAGIGYRKVCHQTLPHRYIHQLVCEAFHGPRPDGLQVRHLNGIKTDNRASNLVWGTPAENHADKVRHGTANFGENNPRSKLTKKEVGRMRHIRAETGLSHKKIAQQFGVSTMTAFRAVEKISWK